MSLNSSTSTRTYEPVSPVDIVSGPRRQRSVGFANHTTDIDEKGIATTTRSVRTNSSSSAASSLGAPRKARFAEATSVHSPATGPNEYRSPFADPPKMGDNGPKPSDVGFGYIADNQPVEQHATLHSDMNPGGAPLKSALKTPGTASRLLNPLSPTFREEQMLEKEEEKTEKEQAKDLKVKTRVRMAKMILRGVNFSCSLIVLSMVATTMMIFNATKSIPSRNNMPAWAKNTDPWPQIVVLTIAGISLVFSIVVIAAYCRGGHRRAEKVAVYYTMFAVGYFLFSIIMWLVGAAILQGSKNNSNGNDIWGWSCKDNKRRTLFQDDVHYALVCRLQDWSLICCIIEIIVEVIVIAIYGVVFYRFYSKNRLRKSMDARDRARSDLYLAQLRSQSAPNTPGFSQTPRTPRFPTATDSKVDPQSAAEQGDSPLQYASITPQSAQTNSAFRLQAPPIKIQHATPRAPQDEFGSMPTSSSPPPPSMSPPPQDRMNEHVAAAPGEQVYESVPIPGAYQPHLNQGPGQAH